MDNITSGMGRTFEFSLWEKCKTRWLRKCSICRKNMSKEEYIYRSAYIGASEHNEIDYACRGCIEKNKEVKK